MLDDPTRISPSPSERPVCKSPLGSNLRRHPSDSQLRKTSRSLTYRDTHLRLFAKTKSRSTTKVSSCTPRRRGTPLCTPRYLRSHCIQVPNSGDRTSTSHHLCMFGTTLFPRYPRQLFHLLRSGRLSKASSNWPTLRRRPFQYLCWPECALRDTSRARCQHLLSSLRNKYSRAPFRSSRNCHPRELNFSWSRCMSPNTCNPR